ncbi:uncharacterized protein LOC107873501 isoform X2 [Capsicum annuum]|uniref:uncharacterized protein LOC107873501 isoform X2 n=1 Tax=Capsicum annuum TaxID=4072 RepID=UPI001FB06EE7|nr:uncharacterized protein LOC107873501 isoform X2 [Capsicum annuum]
MAKRELSGTLRNLKFMQRASLREEKPKKEEDKEVKLSEEGSAACSPEMSDRISKRENGTSKCGFENTDLNDSYDEANKDLTRKQRDTYSEAQYSNKSHKRALDNPTSSQSSSRSFKKPHRPDWSVLKPPKSQNKMR